MYNLYLYSRHMDLCLSIFILKIRTHQTSLKRLPEVPREDLYFCYLDGLGGTLAIGKSVPDLQSMRLPGHKNRTGVRALVTRIRTAIFATLRLKRRTGLVRWLDVCVCVSVF